MAGSKRLEGRCALPTGAGLFGASAESAYLTAQTLNVDGGNVMSPE